MHVFVRDSVVVYPVMMSTNDGLGSPTFRKYIAIPDFSSFFSNQAMSAFVIWVPSKFEWVRECREMMLVGCMH